MIYILKITLEAMLGRHCREAERSREPCEEVIPVIHSYSVAGEK